MKNAMKKLMSLVLVAMILVSALPFAASAEGTTAPLTIVVKDGVNPDVSKEVPGGATLNTTVTIADCLAFAGISAADVVYTSPEADFVITAATTVTIVKKAPVAPQPDPEPQPEPQPEPAPAVAYLNIMVDGVKKYETVGTPGFAQSVAECMSVVGLKAENIASVLVDDSNGNVQSPALNGTFALGAGGTTTNIRFATKTTDTNTNTNTNTNNNNTSGNTTTSNNSAYNKNSGDVVLEICMDKNQAPSKTVSVKNGVALDGVVTLDEVKTVVKKYYGSVDTATGIIYDGLYVKQTYAGNIVEWVNDAKVSSVGGLYEAANNSKLVTIRVYISNARATSSGKADSSNPKTGDGIFMAVATMTASASALATGFYFTKKRSL